STPIAPLTTLGTPPVQFPEPSLISSPQTLTSIPTLNPFDLLTPSMLTSTSLDRFFSLKRIVIGVFAGRTSGLKLRLLGQMGVSSSDATRGWTMLPPLLRLYAVLPVGVEIIIP